MFPFSLLRSAFSSLARVTSLYPHRRPEMLFFSIFLLFDACYDRGIPFFGENAFLMAGLLDPKSSGKKPQASFFFFFLHDISVVYA